ncbi:lipid droplet-associated hydrolase-like [Quercus lobata]|uniref:Lipid droplet-associated hydrolase n=1 Tax=Quercus lobata TaxID=97700 RepID=A0A7N2M6M1_QUELO|nr:lipid droplet-associated hydrolase-like [Quercus lobata]
MLLRPSARPLCLSLSFQFNARRSYRPKCLSKDMGRVELDSKAKRQADFRLCSVSSHMTELLEIRADDPKMHVLLIPGNPGVVTIYKDFVESLYELLEGDASITAINHLSHTKKDWDHGRLFSLEEQTDHKMDFIKQELENIEVPIILVGHSIGSYISIDMFRRSSEKVIYCIGLYPFLALNLQSTEQSIIGKIAASRVLSVALSLIVASLGFLPRSALRLIVTNSLAKSWSAVAVEATCSHLVQYHTMRNALFMAMTEFRKLTATPDWAFMREKKEKLAFLFGGDDHWGPLQMFEEISKQVPGIALSIERGHKHAFSCTEAGASCVAKYVASLIKNQLLHSRQ